MSAAWGSPYLGGNDADLERGKLQAARSLGAGKDPYSVAVGDFNGDGALDLAVANNRSNTVSVLLGNGDGSFQAARNFFASRNPDFVAVGDFNGDSLPDLAVASGSSNTVSVLINNTPIEKQKAR